MSSRSCVSVALNLETCAQRQPIKCSLADGKVAVPVKQHTTRTSSVASSYFSRFRAVVSFSRSYRVRFSRKLRHNTWKARQAVEGQSFFRPRIKSNKMNDSQKPTQLHLAAPSLCFCQFLLNRTLIQLSLLVLSPSCSVFVEKLAVVGTDLPAQRIQQTAQINGQHCQTRQRPTSKGERIVQRTEVAEASPARGLSLPPAATSLLQTQLCTFALSRQLSSRAGAAFPSSACCA